MQIEQTITMILLGPTKETIPVWTRQGSVGKPKQAPEAALNVHAHLCVDPSCSLAVEPSVVMKHGWLCKQHYR